MIDRLLRPVECRPDQAQGVNLSMLWILGGCVGRQVRVRDSRLFVDR